MAVEEEIRGDVADGMYRPKLPTAFADSLCSNGPETCKEDDQNITFQEQQTLNGIDNMAIQQESHGKSLEGIRGPSFLIAGDGDQNTTSQKQTSNTNDDNVVEEMDWSEKEVCIKCNEGGNLLVCSNRNCPLVVHEECMWCAAHFDSKGRFYCPYCSYTQVMLAKRKAKKKAMLAKEALSVFLDGQMVDGGPLDGVRNGEQSVPENEEPDNQFGNIQVNQPEKRSDQDFRANDIATTSARKEQSNVLDRCEVSGRLIADREEETRNRIVAEQESATVRKKSPKVVDGAQKKRLGQDDPEISMGKRRKLVVEPKTSVDSSLHNAETGEKEDKDEEESLKIVDDLQKKRVTQHDQEEAVIGKNPELSAEPEKAMERELDSENNEEEIEMQDGEQEAAGPSREENCLGENDEVAKDSIDEDKSKPSITNTGISDAKRKRQPWTDKEVEMLKEGVGKCSATANKNISWRKILVFGRHVFHGSRSADDLRGKWKRLHSTK